MSSIRTLPLALLGAAVLALSACSSGEAGDTQAEEAASEAAASETASAQELSCFVRGGMGEAQERPSPLQTTEISLGGGEALLCYGSPSARGREIMGGLVPFGASWRMGANEATAIHTPVAASIGGIEVEPGSYSLWAVPGAEEWEIHVNGSVERWGIPINDQVTAADVGSFTVTPGSTDEMVESLTLSWEAQGEDGGHIVLEWENTRVEIPVQAAGTEM